MLSSAFMEPTRGTFDVPIDVPPGLEAPSWPPGLEPSSMTSLLCPPPGLDFVKLNIGDIAGGASDDTSAGSSRSTDGWQSETSSTFCESELSAPSSLADVVPHPDMQVDFSLLDVCHKGTDKKVAGKLQAGAPEFVPSENRTRTALKSSAQRFQPQDPCIPLLAIESAWQQWHAAQYLLHAAMTPAFDVQGMAGNSKQMKQSRKRLSK